MTCSYVLPFYRLSFQFMDSVLLCTEVFNFDKIKFVFSFLLFFLSSLLLSQSYLLSFFLSFSLILRKALPHRHVKFIHDKIYSHIFLKNFMGLALTFWQMVHFKLIFTHDVRRAFNSILLYVPIQLSQHHLLKRQLVIELPLAPLLNMN